MNTALATVIDFNPAESEPVSTSLLQEYVEWIDRSEITTRTYLGNIRAFLAWMKYRGIKAPIRSDVIAYRDWLLSPHAVLDGNGRPVKKNGPACKPSTVALYLRSLSQFFRWTASTGRYPNICANVHGPKVDRNHKRDALAPVEVVAIEESINQHAQEKVETAQAATKDVAGRTQRATEQGLRLAAMYALATNLGLRCIELHRADVRDLVERNGQMWLYIQGKGHTDKDQRKALAEPVAKTLVEYLAVRSDHAPASSPLFTATGNRSNGGRIAVTTISTMLKRALQDAGFNSERLTPHSLRHSCGTAVFNMSNDLFVTQKYLRHASPTTTQIYVHENEVEREASTATQLYEYFHATPEATEATI